MPALPHSTRSSLLESKRPMLKLASDSTKSRVLYFLRGAGGGTAHEVADALEVTTPAARRHLMDLEADGLLESKVHRPGGRGRPQHVFRISEKGEDHFPKRYAQLCNDILEHIESLYGAGAVLSVLDSRNQKLLEAWRPRMQGNLRQRAEALVDILNELGYHAALEPHPSGFVLSQSNCPNLEVARTFESLCASEAILYTHLLGARVAREARVLEGYSACRYVVFSDAT
jgi:predicted ArsR family transcriptional regulator